MSEKLLLIDGHSILNRAFYGLPDLTTADGRHTNAVLGFLNILFRIFEEEQPNYLAVAFDLHAPTFRHKMYDAYKGTRKPMPQELREQVPLMKEVLTAMGIPIVTKEGYEADDILGTLSVRGEKAGLQVVVLSGDRDLLQLATEQVMIRIPKTKAGKTTIENYHAADVIREHGITPHQVIELKALMGDTADNIPGIPGVGEKTGKKIIQEYENIENAYAHLEEIKPNKAKESLREHWDLAVLSKDLATINVDSPIDFSLEDARVENVSAYYTAEAYQMFKQLEFKKLLLRFDHNGVESANASVQMDVQVIGSHDEWILLRDRIKAEREVGVYALIDINHLTNVHTLYGVAFATAKETTYVSADCFASKEEPSELLSELLQNEAVVSTCGLKTLLYGLEIEDDSMIFDAKIAAYLLNPLNSEYAYDTIAREFAGVELRSAEEIFQAKKLPSPALMPIQSASAYAGNIAFASLKSQPDLQKKLQESGMWKLYTDMELPMAYTLYHMESAGIKVHGDELKKYAVALSERLDELEKNIYEQAGMTFNINSPKQLGEILFDQMKLPGGKKTKTGYSTAAAVLEKLAPEVPFVQDILEYRQLAKLKSTYAEGLAAFIADDGRIHGTFHQTITATGRISSADPNLQNIPVRMELGRQIRKVFVPEDGFVFLDADYSQIELRVLAHMSGDQKLIDAYKEEKDIHAITASQVFHVPFDEVTPQLRRNAKAVNFGIVYGISSFGLSQGLSISRKEAAEYIESYFAAYPKVKEFLDRLVSDAKESGYSETMYGRKRPLPELNAGNFMQRQFGERVAMNAPIQGTAADIIKIAMIRVARRLKQEQLKSRLLLQIHDELLIETAIEEKEQVARIMEEEMTGAAALSVRLEIDLNEGANWYEAK